MSNSSGLKVGSSVSVLGYGSPDPWSLVGTVESVSPLRIAVHSDASEDWETGKHVKVLFQNGGRFESADATVSAVKKESSNWIVDLKDVLWIRSDRRSHPRFSARLMTRCRFVVEDAESAVLQEFTVATKDVSVGGVWVESEYSPDFGSILKLEIQTSATDHVNALGVVAWVDPSGKGFGVEFVDLTGSSLTRLTQFLRGHAA